MLSGDNGVLQKATTAKENTDSSQIQERINLAYHSSLVEGQGKVTEPSLESELKKEFKKTTLDEGWLDKTSVEGKWKITIDGISSNVPAGTEQTSILVDESEKLYNALKDKTPQEIMNGVVVDGIETKFIVASGTDATIKYNNQNYIVSLNPSTGSVSSVELGVFEESITFYIQGQVFEAIKGMTWLDWISSDYSMGRFEESTVKGMALVHAIGSNYVTYSGTQYEKAGNYI